MGVDEMPVSEIPTDQALYMNFESGCLGTVREGENLILSSMLKMRPGEAHEIPELKFVFEESTLINSNINGDYK
jgi:hypothetical protein